MSKELKSYLSKKFEGRESFLENIVFPIFGEERFEDIYDVDALDNEDLQAMARRTGIKSAIQYGLVQVGTTEINIYDVTVSDRVMMRRNRVGIQQLIRRIMLDYTSAFIIFHYEDSDSWDWRFSFCQKDNKEVTEAKRYTFLLGPGQSCRTAADNFQKLIDKHGDINRDDIVKAFDVEALSDEFFKKYKSQYEQFVLYITGKRIVKDKGKWVEKKIQNPHPVIYKEFGCDDKRVRDYVKKMMGRIMFLCFLEKKGWLGVSPDNDWGCGDKDFLMHLYQKATDNQKDNFLDAVLEPLFSGALNTNRYNNNDLFDTKVKNLNNNGVLRIPFLNGGLFEMDDDDELSVQFPKEYFEDFLTMLSQYNFTIDENDPDDAEVGIDPEMLGQIFENLLEDNKFKGAYYTPKPIVHYMCKEALKSYLQNNLPKVYKSAISSFVDSYNAELLPMEIVQEVDDILKRIKICDPAIGSGAFPMGLMKQLFFCRAAIEHFDNPEIIKRHIIQENIYGVDLEKGAVDIARLRFWLALIVDEKSPEVLPNLDYKIMKGNSLFTTFNEKYVNISSKQKHSNIVKIQKKKALLHQKQVEFFNKDGEEKLHLMIEIKNLILDIVSLQLGYELKSWIIQNCEEGGLFQDMDSSQISMKEAKAQLEKDKRVIIEYGEKLRTFISDETAPLVERAKMDINFFDWKVMYSDVFPNDGNNSQDNEGFDIVIGNPPYGAKLSDEDKKTIRKFYQTSKSIPNVQKGSMDSYTLFIELAYWLLKKNGFCAMIVPISLTSSDSLSGVHKLLLEKCRGIKISSYAVRPQPVFKNAVVNTSILMFQKTLTPCRQLLSTKMYRKGKDFDLQQLVDNLQFTDVLGFLKFGRIPKIGTEIEKNILRKLSKFKQLSEMCSDKGSPIYYRTSGGRYFKVVTNYSTGSSKEKAILFDTYYANCIGCVLSSNLSFWYYQIISNNLDWKSCELLSFAIPLLSHRNILTLEKLYEDYLKDIEKNRNTRQTSEGSKYKVETFGEYKIVKSKSIIDRIDDYIGPLYGLTKEEIEFVKNYELEFRMAGDD